MLEMLEALVLHADGDLMLNSNVTVIVDAYDVANQQVSSSYAEFGKFRWLSATICFSY